MAIANELSSDVAAAVLAQERNESCADRKDLLELVRNFYSTLRPLKAQARRQRTRSLSKLPAPLNIKSSASSGGSS